MDNSDRSIKQDWYLPNEYTPTCEFYLKIAHRSQASTSSIVSMDSQTSDTDQYRETLCQSKTREGSIQVQQLIESSPPEEVDRIIESICPIFRELSEDNFGNYAVQSLIKVLSDVQRLHLLSSIAPLISCLSYHPKGTHVIQALATLVCLEAEDKVFYEQLRGKVCDFARHPHGIYVLLKLLKVPMSRHLYVREMIGQVYQLATHKVSICVVKVVVRDPQIVNEMMGSVISLMQNPYGNYALQIAIDMWREEISFPVKCAIKGKVVQLCCQKYASNVIEKCLKVDEIRGAWLMR